MPHDTRDMIVDFVRHWSKRTEIAGKRMVAWIGISSSKYHDWQGRYGKVNEHNAWIPRDHGVDEEEKGAILDFHRPYPREGYRRLTFMMLDRDVVAVSPSRVYRVLRGAGSQVGRSAGAPQGPPRRASIGCRCGTFHGAWAHRCGKLGSRRRRDSCPEPRRDGTCRGS